MKQKGKRKKPTLKDVVIVVNSLIQEIQAIKSDMRTLSGLINMYIEFEGNGDSFEAHINKQVKKENNEVQGDAKSSSKTDWRSNKNKRCWSKIIRKNR